VKTLFISCDTEISFNGNDENGNPGTTDIKYGVAGGMPSTEVFRVHPQGSRWMNPKYSGISGHHNVYHLRAREDDTVPSDYWGVALPTVGTPTTTHSCIIYWKQMEADANEQEVSASLFWNRAKDTIGHECAHGTGLYDCYDGSGHCPYSNYCYMNNSIWFDYNPYEFNTHHNSEYDHWSQ